ncbi:hypothetical protein J6590_014175 [Homalodisca vitripennis]|nr:hypothetical protein J6590_014175 [Homalodisca vitripennis]
MYVSLKSTVMLAEMKCVTLLACLVLSIAVFYAQAMPPPPQCTPGIIEEIPLRMRKLCTALSTIYELSNAMESYLDDKGVVYQQRHRVLACEATAERLILNNMAARACHPTEERRLAPPLFTSPLSSLL